MKYITIILIFILGLYSCNVGTYESWSNENIDPKIKEEIKQLDEQVIRALVQNNSTKLKGYMSSGLLEQSGNDIAQLVNQVNGVITNENYRILDQFYVKSTTEGISNTVMSGINDKDDYVIHYKALNKDMFISLIISTNGMDELLITNIYGKYKNEWKLNIIQFNAYSLNGMIATELYQKAKEQYEKGYLIDATNYMFLSSQVSRPANALWKYQVEDDMKDFMDEILKEAKSKYQFPITLYEIDSKPQIINVSPKGMDEGYFPMVDYLTTIDLNDTASTRIENDKIHKSIGNIFKGLDKDKKYIFYKAWNEIPNGKDPIPNYGFAKEMK